jgi:hypothetical protein
MVILDLGDAAAMSACVDGPTWSALSVKFRKCPAAIRRSKQMLTRSSAPLCHCEQSKNQ